MYGSEETDSELCERYRPLGLAVSGFGTASSLVPCALRDA